MSKYVDGFVIVLPKKNLATYRRMATLGGKVWKKHGALDYVEFVMDPARYGNEPIPFDMRRIAVAGFKAFVDL